MNRKGTREARHACTDVASYVCLVDKRAQRLPRPQLFVSPLSPPFVVGGDATRKLAKLSPLAGFKRTAFRKLPATFVSSSTTRLLIHRRRRRHLPKAKPIIYDKMRGIFFLYLRRHEIRRKRSRYTRAEKIMLNTFARNILLKKSVRLAVDTFSEIQMSHWMTIVSRRYCDYQVVRI